MDYQIRRYTFEGNRILWKNFSGRASKFPDSRSFILELKPEEVDKLVANGWPVEWWEPRKPDEPPTPVIRVDLKFNDIPMMIVKMDSINKTRMTKETVGDLDGLFIINADTKCNLGNTGKVYLNELWVTIQDNPLEAKYASIPWSE